MSLEKITLRDYFAGQALSGLLAIESYEVYLQCEALYENCYAHADAMLKEREKS